MTKAPQEVSAQKALRIKVKSQLGFALNDLKSLMSEEQFKKRIKKAAKLITDGLPERTAPAKEETPTTQPKVMPVTKPAVKKTAPAKKTTAVKKAPVKKTAPAKKGTTKAVKKTATKK